VVAVAVDGPPWRRKDTSEALGLVLLLERGPGGVDALRRLVPWLDFVRTSRLGRDVAPGWVTN